MSEDSAAEDQIAAFIDRILRLKAEADDIAADIKEIYAEAHGSGFNKTRLGEIVTYLRKVERDASKVEEAETIRDLYLTAYYRAKNKPLARIRVRDPKTTTEPQPETAAQTVTADAPVVASPVESEAVEISTPILEQQPAPAARDLTSDLIPQGDSGQVATHTPEMANELPPPSRGIGGEDDLREPVATEQGQIAQEGDAPLEAAANANGEGVSGHAAHLSTHLPTYAEPGEVVMESCPPVGIVTHPYAACWPVNTVNVEDGIRQPIVKIGNLILDGRGRYFAARAAHVEYPVVQYAGDDDLADSITWNLASRPNMDPRALRIVAEKLAKLVPDRAEEIMERFGFNEEQRAAQ